MPSYKCFLGQTELVHCSRKQAPFHWLHLSLSINGLGYNQDIHMDKSQSILITRSLRLARRSLLSSRYRSAAFSSVLDGHLPLHPIVVTLRIVFDRLRISLARERSDRPVSPWYMYVFFSTPMDHKTLHVKSAISKGSGTTHYRSNQLS